jgi:hypothetical protein
MWKWVFSFMLQPLYPWEKSPLPHLLYPLESASVSAETVATEQNLSLIGLHPGKNL